MHALRWTLRSLLLSSLWLLVPGVGLAAEEAPSDAPRASSLVPSRHEAAVQPASSKGLRILAGAGLGSIAAAAGGLGGYNVGAALCQRSTGPWGLGCLDESVTGMTLGVALSYPLAVWLGGEALGGDGQLWAALLGSGVGLSMGVPFLLMGQGLAGVGMLGAGVMSLVGSHVGYELSQRAPPSHVASTKTRVQPLLSFSRQGAMLGLSGAF